MKAARTSLLNIKSLKYNTVALSLSLKSLNMKKNVKSEILKKVENKNKNSVDEL